MAITNLLLLGVGSVAQAVRAALPEAAAAGTTRREPDERFEHLPALRLDDSAAIIRAAHGAHVVVSFPPDGLSDARLAPLVGDAQAIAYLSSTAVYRFVTEHVNETTPTAANDERGRLRLEAERIWQSRGASVVRLPAFYGPRSGLHLSLARGAFRMVGRGENIVSRVHVDDAAKFVIAALGAPPASLLLAGDDEPCAVGEVARFVAELFSVPPPVSATLDAVPLSLRGSRRIDSRTTRARFGLELTYPTYREGYRAIQKQLGSS